MKYKINWLRDSLGDLNYSRVVGSILLLIFQPTFIVYTIVKYGIDGINNLFQFLIICIPSIVAVFLLLIDLFRDKNYMKIKFGISEISVGDKDEKPDTESTQE
jgi:hypothetical protein